MKMPPRKVTTISGQPVEKDVVKQAELARLGDLQAIAWEAEAAAHRAALSLRVRLDHGATVESGEWYFDRELEMARKRRQERKA